MYSTRQRILDYLDQRGSASARQLAQAFGMSAANLRRHLGILGTRGLIAPVGKRPAEGRGRPEQMFALTSASHPEMESLTRALLTTLGSSSLRRGQQSPMMSLANNLIGPRGNPPEQITQRLVATVRRLEPLGYKPHWEARPAGPRMVFGRCPYAAIIADHPELCQMDAHMLEAMLDSPVDQLVKLGLGPQMIPHCLFKIGKIVNQKQ